MLIRDCPVPFLADDVSVAPSEKTELLFYHCVLLICLFFYFSSVLAFRSLNILLKIYLKKNEDNNLLKRNLPVKNCRHTTPRQVPARKSSVYAETPSLRLAASHERLVLAGCWDAWTSQHMW